MFKVSLNQHRPHTGCNVGSGALVSVISVYFHLKVDFNLMQEIGGI